MELRNGVTDSASRVPFRRWTEVELHHVDLGIGYELEDLPAEFVETIRTGWWTTCLEILPAKERARGKY